MGQFCEFAENVLKSGGYEHIYCFVVQVSFRRRYFRARTDGVEGDVGETMEFVEKQTPLDYTPEHDYYLQDPRSERLWHPNVEKKGLAFGIEASCSILHLPLWATTRMET